MNGITLIILSTVQQFELAHFAPSLFVSECDRCLDRASMSHLSYRGDRQKNIYFFDLTTTVTVNISVCVCLIKSNWSFTFAPCQIKIMSRSISSYQSNYIGSYLVEPRNIAHWLSHRHIVLVLICFSQTSTKSSITLDLVTFKLGSMGW